MELVDKAKDLLTEACKEKLRVVQKLQKLDDLIAALSLATENGSTPKSQPELFETGKKFKRLDAAVRQALINNAGQVLSIEEVVAATRPLYGKHVKKGSVNSQLWFDQKNGLIHRQQKGFYVLPVEWVGKLQKSIPAL